MNPSKTSSFIKLLKKFIITAPFSLNQQDLHIKKIQATTRWFFLLAHPRLVVVPRRRYYQSPTTSWRRLDDVVQASPPADLQDTRDRIVLGRVRAIPSTDLVISRVGPSFYYYHQWTPVEKVYAFFFIRVYTKKLKLMEQWKIKIVKNLCYLSDEFNLKNSFKSVKDDVWLVVCNQFHYQTIIVLFSPFHLVHSTKYCDSSIELRFLNYWGPM